MAPHTHECENHWSSAVGNCRLCPSRITLSQGDSRDCINAAIGCIIASGSHAPETRPGRVRAIKPYWEEGAHGLRVLSNVIDIRNFGLIAGIELASRAGKPGGRAARVFQRCFGTGLLERQTGDVIALSPPLIVEKPHVDQIFSILGDAITAEAT